MTNPPALSCALPGYSLTLVQMLPDTLHAAMCVLITRLFYFRAPAYLIPSHYKALH